MGHPLRDICHDRLRHPTMARFREVVSACIFSKESINSHRLAARSLSVIHQSRAVKVTPTGVSSPSIHSRQHPQERQLSLSHPRCKRKVDCTSTDNKVVHETPSDTTTSESSDAFRHCNSTRGFRTQSITARCVHSTGNTTHLIDSSLRSSATRDLFIRRSWS